VLQIAEIIVDTHHDRWDGTLIICTPTLAYYEGELGYRFILFYPAAPGHVRAMTR